MGNILDTSHLDQSIDKLEIYSDKHKIDVSKFNVANPHPGFGKDPNIKNEKGHTNYPKKITDKNGKRVTVKNELEEAEATGNATVENENKPANNGWS